MSILVKDPTRDDNVCNLLRKNKYCKPCNDPITCCPTVIYKCSNCCQKMIAARLPCASDRKHNIPSNTKRCYIACNSEGHH